RLLEQLALEPITHALVPGDIADEVQKDLLLALGMLEFESEEKDGPGLSRQS
ncbi:hypothetical protein C0995_002109, partial [Termitomyces sp. Mi166